MLENMLYMHEDNLGQKLTKSFLPCSVLFCLRYTLLLNLTLNLADLVNLVSFGLVGFNIDV